MNHKEFQDYGNIFSFATDKIKSNGVFARANRLMKYTRRYFFISRLIKYMSTIIAFIETSATLVVLSTVLLISIPVTCLILAVVSLWGFYRYRSFNPRMGELISKSQKIMFIYAPHGYGSKKAAFMRGMARDFTKRGYTVFIVSNSLLTDRFSAARQVGERLWILKLNYFYTVKKKFLTDAPDSNLVFVS